MLRWVSAFLIGFDHFLPDFDRNLIPFGGVRSGFDHLILYTLVNPIGIVRIPAAFSGGPKNKRDDYRVGKIGGLGKVAPAEFFRRGSPAWLPNATTRRGAPAWVPNAVVCRGRPPGRPAYMLHGDGRGLQ